MQDYLGSLVKKGKARSGKKVIPLYKHKSNFSNSKEKEKVVINKCA